MLISSQRYLDDDIVASKRLAADYTVRLSPAFAVAGIEVQVIVDGHHAFAAALADGASPEFVTVDARADDRVALLAVSVDDFLEACFVDADWYDVATGKPAF